MQEAAFFDAPRLLIDRALRGGGQDNITVLLLGVESTDQSRRIQMDNLIGKKLDGRYLIESLIGVGGMANVYKGQDIRTGNGIAVKVLKEEFLGNEELVRRFKNESKAISILDHPNIVKVYDVSVTDQLQYIVMEYIDGITLKEYMEYRAQPLTYKETLHFITQVLAALQHAHEKGIVHRDIKPQNIMLLADSTIKVMDFGIARFSRSENQTMTDKPSARCITSVPNRRRAIPPSKGGHLFRGRDDVRDALRQAAL